MQRIFDRLSSWSSGVAGSSPFFAVLLAAYVAWGLSGPIMGFSDTWQLIANTATTLLTTMLVVLVQYTQNKGSEAMQAKLDALVRAMDGAPDKLVRVEENDAQNLRRIREEADRAEC